jgi:hypothetical protein
MTRAMGRMESWNSGMAESEIGIMEYWNDGMLGIASIMGSSIPMFQSSIVLFFQHSSP